MLFFYCYLLLCGVASKITGVCVCCRGVCACVFLKKLKWRKNVGDLCTVYHPIKQYVKEMFCLKLECENLAVSGRTVFNQKDQMLY